MSQLFSGKRTRINDEIFHFSGALTLAFCLLSIQWQSISGQMVMIDGDYGNTPMQNAIMSDGYKIDNF